MWSCNLTNLRDAGYGATGANSAHQKVNVTIHLIVNLRASRFAMDLSMDFFERWIKIGTIIMIHDKAITTFGLSGLLNWLNMNALAPKSETIFSAYSPYANKCVYKKKHVFQHAAYHRNGPLHASLSRSQHQLSTKPSVRSHNIKK